MTIVSSGAISINSLVGEYGGSAPHAMNEYYRGGSLVANHSNNANVPTSGQISLDDFYGANNTSPAPTVYSYSMTSGTQGGNFPDKGFDTGVVATFGSLSNNPKSVAFSSGFNPTIKRWSSDQSLTKVGAVLVNMFLTVSGNVANSGWTSLSIPGAMTSPNNGTLTLNRSAATYQSPSQGFTDTTWQFSAVASQFVSGVTGTVTITE
tara:strand:+ start:340 stop:960 length:621 start_codon:yes stop_codon:yes gene_type:complete